MDFLVLRDGSVATRRPLLRMRKSRDFPDRLILRSNPIDARRRVD